MKIFPLHDVFTPNKPAVVTFVEREKINNKLVRALETPGKQIVVYGHSGSGKSTLLLNKLYQTYETHITSRCLSSTTFEQLILDAFDQLEPYYCSEKIDKKVHSIDSSLQTEYIGIKSQLKASISESVEIKKTRVIPPQLTPQRLAKFIGSTGCCWVIEDFHKVEEKHKQQISETMKVFVDLAVEYSSLKIIALGAVSSARDVVELESNMKGRVSEIHVPLMDETEILQILTLGERALRTEFPVSVKKDIIKYSNGLAMVCHQLALNTCDAANVRTTSVNNASITTDHFAEGVENYVEDEADTLQVVFDNALKQKRKRTYDNCRIILKTLALAESNVGYTKSELFEMIRQEHQDYPPGNLTIYLEQLQTEERSSILRLDDSSEKYQYANPFHKVFARLLFSKTPVKLKQLELPIESSSLTRENISRIMKTIEATKVIIRTLEI